MHPKKLKLAAIISCFIFSLVIIIAVTPNIGIAKQQFPFSANFSDREQSIVASRYRKENFGERGRSGSDGRDGVAGDDGKNIPIVVNGEVANYNVAGSDGTDGKDGTPGENARNCYARRRPPYSLKGADGGNGGNGGSGGNAGNGGDVTIFYQNPADLKKITLNNSGGKGGRPGRGDNGGYGCSCPLKEWKVDYCKWDLLKKRRDVANAKWKFDSSKTLPCRRNKPSSRRNSKRWVYRWKYKGFFNSKRYQCHPGKNGRDGRDGSRGKNGRYGKLTLVPRSEIPQEKTRYYGQLSQILGKNIQLVKNIWVQKQGLASLLNPTSDVPDAYTYLQDTARPQYRIAWNAKATPADLGISNTKVGAAIKLERNKAKIDFQVPGTLEYRISQDQKVKVLTVTGGFAPSRVKSFQIKNISGAGKNTKLTLVDKGDVRKLLKSSSIEVILKTKESQSGQSSDDYQFRHSLTFKIPPATSPSSGVKVSQNIYTIDMGRFFWPWLKSGYNTAVDVKVTQKTKSGAVYTHSINTTYQVPEL